MQGTIIRLLPNRGFGFIRGMDGLSRFFEAKEVVPAIDFDRMYEGQCVMFTPTENTGPEKEPSTKHNNLRASHVSVT